MASRSDDTVEIRPKTGVQIYLSRPWELIKTGFLVVTWIILGIHLELVGPTLKILALQTATSFSGISTIFIARGVGYMVGNIIGAVMQNIVKRHSEGFIAFGFLLASVVVLATPHTGSLFLLSVLFFFQGISQGFTDIGGTNLILTMWGDHAATPLNTVHLGFGFGAVFANLLLGSFLTDNQIVLSDSTSTVSQTAPLSSSNISIPYAITAILCFLIAVGHLIFSIREHRTRRETLQVQKVNYATVPTSIVPEAVADFSQYSPRSCGYGNLFYGLFMSILWIAYMFFVSANDQTFSKFFFSYLGSPEFNISTKNATLGMVLYWLSYSIGRLICAIAVMFVPVHLALSALWIGGVALAITWIVYVWTIGLSITSLFVLGSFTGLIFSPIFPLSFGFINQRLNVNPLLVGLILCGAAVGAMSFQKIAGVLLDENPKHFPTLLIICVLMSIVLYFAALFFSIWHKKQDTKNSSRSKSTSAREVPQPSEEEQQMTTYLAESEKEQL